MSAHHVRVSTRECLKFHALPRRSSSAWLPLPLTSKFTHFYFAIKKSLAKKFQQSSFWSNSKAMQILWCIRWTFHPCFILVMQVLDHRKLSLFDLFFVICHESNCSLAHFGSFWIWPSCPVSYLLNIPPVFVRRLHLTLDSGSSFSSKLTSYQSPQ